MNNHLSPQLIEHIKRARHDSDVGNPGTGTKYQKFYRKQILPLVAMFFLRSRQNEKSLWRTLQTLLLKLQIIWTIVCLIV
jgi:hypothetical protein